MNTCIPLPIVESLQKHCVKGFSTFNPQPNSVFRLYSHTAAHSTLSCCSTSRILRMSEQAALWRLTAAEEKGEKSAGLKLWCVFSLSDARELCESLFSAFLFWLLLDRVCFFRFLFTVCSAWIHRKTNSEQKVKKKWKLSSLEINFNAGSGLVSEAYSMFPWKLFIFSLYCCCLCVFRQCNALFRGRSRYTLLELLRSLRFIGSMLCVDAT